MPGISLENIKKYRNNYLSRKENSLIGQSIQKNGVLNACFNNEEAFKLRNVFNIEVKDMPSVTYQKQSGRCWMFASLNIIRKNIATNLGLKDIELSESYLFFYDKLEKCNYRLSLTIDYINEKEDSRILSEITNVGGNFDGGYWHYFKELVKKYGIVPKTVMDESHASSNSKDMDKILNVLVSKDTQILRDAYKDGKSKEELVKLKDKMLDEIYRVLGMCLGLPTENFIFEYNKDNDNKDFVRINTTPLEFFKTYVTLNLDDYVVCVSHKNDKYPFYQKYQNEFAKNMSNEDYSVYNLPIDELKDLAINSLKDDKPVFFACDVLIYAIRENGLLSRKVINIDDIFNIDFGFDKFNRIEQNASFWNHAMTFTGVNIDDNNKPNRWKIQNSWGTEVGDKGIFICDDDWFTEFVYQVMVDKKYFNEKELEGLKKDVKVIKPWEHLA